ncbi:hypothetical protein N9B90_00785 [bacterium]|nr:hypothetical protein [bacterium]
MNQICSKLLYAAVMAVVIAAAWTCLQSMSGSPEPDAWRSQLGLDSLWLSWGMAEAASEGSARLVFRGLYALLLDLGQPYHSLGWVVLASSVLAFLLLARWVHLSIGNRLGPLTKALLTLVICAAMFSPVYGANWLLVERFRVFVPLLCLAVGGLLLRRGRYFVWRYFAAMIFAQIALLTDVVGLWVWVALLPCCATIAEGRRRWACLGIWVVAGNVGALACEFSFGSSASSEGSWVIRALMTKRGSYLSDVAATLGRSLSNTWPVELDYQLVVGWAFLVLLLVTSIVAWRRLNASVATWWAFALFGIGAALTSSAQVCGIDINMIARREIEWSALVFPVGIVGLLAEFAGHRFVNYLRLLLASLLVLLVFDWRQGVDDLAWRQAQLREFEARLLFYELDKLGPDQVGLSPFSKGLQLRRAQNRRLLRYNEVIEDADGKLQAAALELSVVANGEIRDVGGQSIAGVVASTAEMVWIAQESEGKEWQWIRSIPLSPSQEQGCHSWLLDFDRTVMPPEGSALAVFAFDLDTLTFVPLVGRVQVTGQALRMEQGK